MVSQGGYGFGAFLFGWRPAGFNDSQLCFVERHQTQIQAREQAGEDEEDTDQTRLHPDRQQTSSTAEGHPHRIPLMYPAGKRKWYQRLASLICRVPP